MRNEERQERKKEQPVSGSLHIPRGAVVTITQHPDGSSTVAYTIPPEAFDG